MRYTLIVMLGIAASSVVACGKKQPVAPSIHRPVANAGGNQIVAVNQTVTLDASRSFDPDGDDLTYLWKQVRGPPVAITNSTAVQAAVTLKAKGRYVFEVSVSDGTEMAAVRVAVTVGKPPMANAGDDRTVRLNQPVMLDASRSLDADGDSLTYQWQQISGPPITMTNSASVRAMVTLERKGSYVFEVSVSDGTETTADSLTVTVQNYPPVANAGEDKTVRPNESVTLDASISSDPDGDSLTYQWQQVSGLPVTLVDAQGVRASFTAVAHGAYAFGVSVSDGTVVVEDQVKVTVADPLQVSTTIEMALKQAMERRAIEEFGDLLDPNYVFSEPSLVDSLSFVWGRDTERRTVDAIFRSYSTFTFDYRPVRQWIELKEEYPATLPDGTPNKDGHPDEDWVVMYGLVQMTMRDKTGDNGYDVNQKMEFKLRNSGEAGKDLDGNPLYPWKIIRWIDRQVE